MKSSMSSSSSRPPAPLSSSQIREMSFVREVTGAPTSRSSSEDSTTDLRLDVDATGGDLESRPRLRRVNLFLLRAKVSPVFSSRSSRSSSSSISSSSKAYRKAAHVRLLPREKRGQAYPADGDVFCAFCAAAFFHLRPQVLQSYLPKGHPLVHLLLDLQASYPLVALETRALREVRT